MKDFMARLERRHGGADGIPVVNMPYGQGNPYQGLLYAGPDTPYRCVSGRKDEIHRIADAAFEGGPKILHLHWDDRIFGRADGAEANEAHRAAVLSDLRRFRSGGGRILWTIHNGRPQTEGDRAAFEAGRRALADLADAVHVHTAEAARHMTTTWGVPDDRLHVVPHPSYLGVYEDEAATLARPLPASDLRAFLFFGMLRRSKGLVKLKRATARLAERDLPFRLALCGKAFRLQLKLVRRIAEHPGVTTRTDRVPDDEVAGLFGAAQVFLAPYDDLFTSGAIMLAQTFGLPVIGPDTPAMRDLTAEGNRAFLYPPDDARGLYKRMKRAIGMPDRRLARHRAAALDFARARHPHVVSARIAAVLDGLGPA